MATPGDRLEAAAPQAENGRDRDAEASRFVHLHVHTQYSIVDGLVRIPDLMRRVAEANMPAVALTDLGNLFAMVKFYKQALARGIKPIIGVELRLAADDAREPPSHLILLCQNQAGYRNLTRLVTRAYREGQSDGVPLADRAWLTPESTQGLIALSGGIAGDVAQAALARDTGAAETRLAHWRELFGDRFYLQVSRTGREPEDAWVDIAVGLAADHGIPIVATNDVRFVHTTEFEAHEARVCIHAGRTLNDSTRPRPYSAQQYVRTPAEMRALFSDLPEAIENTVLIAQRCSLDLELGKSYLPAFPTPNGESAEEWLRQEARRGLAKKIADGADADSEDETYAARLERELDVICDMGFPGYFLIVADFIRWARENGVPVGPGRGSGAGSLVAWVLGITDIDPLEHDLLFERFLNPERVSMPDFDVDFCMEGRDRVIAYVAERYGRERVSQIITYGTMAARAVVRDAGRVLDFPFGFFDRIAKMVPFEVGMTLTKALRQDAELRQLYESDDEVRSIIDLALSLEGCVRNAGKHAGGVVIAPTELTDFTPLYCEEGGGSLVTQFDKDDVEAAGLVKFDFLGLRTLTIIDRAIAAVNRTRQAAGEPPIDLGELTMDDPKAYQLLQQCRTTAVFQLESRGMKELIKRLRPDSFEDLVALVALYRPGPLQSGMVDDFINRKHGVAGQSIDYLHPDLEPVLESTYGVILYQEQVMQIAQVLADYSLGGADMLRRAMGKKKPEEMAKQRVVFLTGCAKRGVDQKQAEHIFDLMEKFAGYGFNKSHSAAYAVLSYQTAWLKAHYPAEFMAAVMTSDMDNTEKLVALKDDCRESSLSVLPPDINSSAAEFEAADSGTIRYGLAAIKGVGRAAVDSMLAERERNGSYRSLRDLCRRIDLERVKRNMLEALIKSGALDAIGPNRRTLMEHLGDALRSAEQAARARAAGQNDMFGALLQGGPAAGEDEADGGIEPLGEWDERDRLRAEKEALGLYLTGHPFAAWRRAAVHLTSGPLGELTSAKPPAGAENERDFAQPKREVTVAGLIFEMRKRGNRMSLTLDDESGRLDVQLFSEVYDNCRHLLVKDAIVIVTGSFRWDSFLGAWSVAAKRVRAIDHVVEERARHLYLEFERPDDEREAERRIGELRELLAPHRGGACEISVIVASGGVRARLVFGPRWKVRLTGELRDGLERLFGADAMRIVFEPDS